MKTLTRIFFAVAALFALACTTDATEDLAVQMGSTGSTTLSISLEGTKTHLGEKSGTEYPLYWCKGDQIAINGIASQPLTEEAEGKAVATFSFDKSLTYPYNIVYPAPIVELDLSLEGVRAEGTQSVSFLAEQPYKAGTFADDAAPMYAQVAAAGESIVMKHLAGALRIAPKGEGVTLTSMTVSAEKGKLAGAFEVDCATGALTASAEATNVVTVSFGEGLALGAEATPIYVAVPAGEYGVITVTLHTAADKMVAKFNTDGEKAVKAGVVREFSEFAYQPTAEEGGVLLIESKDDLIAFAQKAATLQPTTLVQLAAQIDMTDEAWTPIDGFAGTFDGDKDGGFYIKGLSAPLFGTTSAKIKNLKLTDVNIIITEPHTYNEKPAVYSGAIAYRIAAGELTSCYASGVVEVNSTTLNTADADLIGTYLDVCVGGMVGVLDSTITSNCESHIDLTLTSIWNDSHASGFSVKAGAMFGAAANGTQISSCDNYGDIICNLTHAMSKNVHMGTLLGGSNADNALKVFTDCTNYGNFRVPATASRQSIYYVGGIAGMLNKGIEECKNLTNLGCGELLGSGNAKEWRVGGIAGALYSSADNLVNGSATDSTKGCIRICGDAATKNGNTYLAGMSYTSTAELTNSKNYGTLTIEGYSENTYLSGMLGTTSSANVTNCENHGTLIHNLAAVKVQNIGGILAQGYVAADNTSIAEFTIKGCKNAGHIVYNVAEGAAVSGVRVIGGIYGYGNLKNGTTVVNIENCTTSGIITVVDKSNKDQELAVAAVNGYTQYGGGITFTNCKAESKIYVGYDVNLTSGVATPIEGHTFAGKMKAAGIQAMFTKRYIATGCDFAGEINIHGNFTKSDQIQIGGYGGYGAGMCTFTDCKFSGKINLSDATQFNSSSVKQVFVSGFLGYPAHDTAENTQIFTNCSTTKESSITVGAQHNNGAIYIGGLLAYTGKKAPFVFVGCHSHGTITTTKSAKSTGDFCVGGIISYRGTHPATLRGCYNEGNINIEGDSFQSIYVGGVAGYTTTLSVEVDSAYPYSYNTGNITVGNKGEGAKPITAAKNLAVGGYFAVTTSTKAYDDDLANSGNIIVDNAKAANVYVAGVWAFMNGDAKIASTAKYTNIGNVTVSNIDAPKEATFVGGVMGSTKKSIDGAQSYCEMA